MEPGTSGSVLNNASLETRSVGEPAFEILVAETRTQTPEQAVMWLCHHLRQRVASMGWSAGLDTYLRAFGIEAVEAPIADDGRLDFRNGRYVILVRQEYKKPRSTGPLSLSSASNRQRFSVAHELGHVLLIEQLGRYPEHLRALRGSDRVERLCDLAAAELLVPMDSFRAQLSRARFRIRRVDELAVEFGVSREVILRRFLAAGARAVVTWKVPSHLTRGGWSASARRVFVTSGGPPVAQLRDTSGLKPDVVRRAAFSKLGWARSANLEFWRGRARWGLSAIAIAEPIADVGSTEAQLDLLGFQWESRESRLKSLGAAVEACDLLVLLILLPSQAPWDATSLWHAVKSR